MFKRDVACIWSLVADELSGLLSDGRPTIGGVLSPNYFTFLRRLDRAPHSHMYRHSLEHQTLEGLSAHRAPLL